MSYTEAHTYTPRHAHTTTSDKNTCTGRNNLSLLTEKIFLDLISEAISRQSGHFLENWNIVDI